MPNFREFNSRLETMAGMRRVTSTMKMVAASHLHKMQMNLTKPDTLTASLMKLVPVVKQARFRNNRLCLPPPEKGGKVLLIVISADRGLCGSFNNTVVHAAKDWLKEQENRDFKKIDTLYIGQKAYLQLRNILPTRFKVLPASAHPTIHETEIVARKIMRLFSWKIFDEVWLINNAFVNTMTHRTDVRRILPDAKPSPVSKQMVDEIPGNLPEIIEPNDERMLNVIASLWLHLALHYALTTSVTSEHAARVMAMENSTVSLHRMEKELILQRNRARQAAITNELTEIVSGAEALK